MSEIEIIEVKQSYLELIALEPLYEVIQLDAVRLWETMVNEF